MKTSELTGAALDWAVATAKRRGPKYDMKSHGQTWCGWWLAAPGHEYEPMPSYSTDWSQGGPIIEREGLDLFRYEIHGEAVYKNPDADYADLVLDYLEPSQWAWMANNDSHGPTPLIAAMRCYVASKLGDEVDVPEGLV
jgi:hypothetical protein